MMHKMLALLAVAAAVATVAQAETITYPECPVNGTGCCDFGTGSMRNRGYVKLSLPEDIIVTCSRGALLCQSGNTGLHASEVSIEGVTCPDFTALMTSDSASVEEDGSGVVGTVAPASEASETAEVSD